MQCIYILKQLKAVQLGNFQIDYYTLLKIYCWVSSKYHGKQRKCSLLLLEIQSLKKQNVGCRTFVLKVLRQVLKNISVAKCIKPGI